MLQQILAASGLPGKLLEIELTESVLMSNVHRQSQILEEIKLLGIQIAIDDFGTGYSSMAYLRRLPLDRMKVDRAFIRDLTEQPNDRAIVAAMVALAHSLDLQVIAEGVETTAQRDMLHALDVDELQGYLLGKPMSATAFRMLLDNGQSPAQLPVKPSGSPFPVPSGE
jgi:EAL domain-containing protein (putative c-di-GMP-specific phosphodiesterase class I)